MYLDFPRKKAPQQELLVTTEDHVIGNVVVDENAVIGDGCLIEHDVMIG